MNNMQQPPWKAILTKEKNADLIDLLISLMNFLDESAPAASPSLMAGKAGSALMWAYNSKILNEKDARKSWENLEHIISDINRGFNYPAFANGITGICWAINHLRKYDLVNIEDAEILDLLQPYVIDHMKEATIAANLDYLHGAIGNGLFLLDRSEVNTCRAAVEWLITYIDKQKHVDKLGNYMWMSVLQKEPEKKGYNLSLAHGMASVIHFLARCVYKEIKPSLTKSLLKGAVGFLFQHKLSQQKSNALFPSWISEDEIPPAERLAWCYGDLGILASTLSAAIIIEDSVLKNSISEMLRKTSQRKSLTMNFVEDPYFCHGVGGIAHTFNRIYQYTGEKVFLDTAVYWYEQLKNFSLIKDFNEQCEKRLCHSLLDGYTGLVLSLLAAFHDVSPDWDQCLLLSYT